MINMLRVVLFVSFALPFEANAEGLVEPASAINGGQLVLSDGSSVFIFNKDKTFESGPHGLSGRTIKGTWQLDKSGGYLVKGTWGWINGLSPKNDERTMLIHIGSLSDELQEIRTSIHPKLLIRKGYFFIDSLQKVKASQALGRPETR